MILKEIYISSFGNVSNYTLNLKEGLNTITQENGWGKTTLASFIRIIFYGITNDKKSNISENDRLRFKPWNSLEKFGGYVIFQFGERELKIERYFGNKASEDILRLFDNITGKEITSGTDNLGERILQINQEGFISTTYFSQKDLGVKSNSSITNKYNQIFDTEDNSNYENIILKLENQAKIYKAKNTASKGLIADTKAEILRINNKIEQVNRQKELFFSLQEKISVLSTKIASEKKEIEKLNNDILLVNRQEAIVLKSERLKACRNELDDVDNNLNQTKKMLNGATVNEEQISALKNCIIEKTKAEGAMLSYKEELDSISKQDKKTSKSFLYLGFLSLVFAILSSALFLINAISSIACIFIFSLGAVFAFIKNNSNAQNVKRFIEATEQAKRKYISQQDIYNEYSEHIDRFFSAFNINPALEDMARLNALQEAIDKLALLSSKRAKLNIEIENLINELKGVELLSVNNAKEISENLTKCKNNLSLMEKEYNICVANSNNLSAEIDSLTDLENKKEFLNENLSDYVRQYNLIMLTIGFIKQANENYKAKYRKPLLEAFNKYYAYVDKEKNISIDTDFKVTVNEEKGGFSQDYYSKGLIDLFEICKRFALIEVLFTAEKPFVILDDPFVNLDDDKLKLAKDLVKKLSNDFQIIYLTCHSVRSF